MGNSDLSKMQASLQGNSSFYYMETPVFGII